MVHATRVPTANHHKSELLSFQKNNLESHFFRCMCLVDEPCSASVVYMCAQSLFKLRPFFDLVFKEILSAFDSWAKGVSR